ncbi:MAG: UDP-glucose 4-epimerase GalE [Crocinitomicaceae bacterium]|nr:UDP-glucose 4-epimerase GalE [Crocinitomicaceae bacterium]
MMEKGPRKRILVTGGAGFIGSHAAVALHEAGYAPVIIDDLRNSRKSAVKGIESLLSVPVEWHRVDCGDAEAMKPVFKQPVHGAIHFAADKAVGESVAHPEKYFDNNVGGTARFVAQLRNHGVQHLVFSSSCTVYGEAEELPVSEDAPILPAASPYGYTKQACEDLLRITHAAAEGQLGISILRYFNPIGAHPSAHLGELPLGPPPNLVPYLLQAVAGNSGPLIVFGDNYPTPDGTCIRDYLHVCDLAEAHVAALRWLEQHQGALDVFNLGTGRGTSVKEVITAFHLATGLDVPHKIGDRRPGDVTAIYADAAKADEVLGWRTTRSLEDCLRDAWRWQQRLQDTPS